MENEIIISHSTKIRVTYADTDKMGVVNNGVYFRYFEIGRTELMREVGLAYTDVEKTGYLLPLIESHANYLVGAEYDDELRIQAELKLEYKPIVKFIYNIFRANTTIAKGYTVHSFIRSDNRKPVKPPKIFFDSVNEYFKKNMI